MAYRTILVELDAEASARTRLEVAGGLALRFDAMLVGIHMPPLMVPNDAGRLSMHIPPETLEAQQRANLRVRDRALAIFREVCGQEGPKIACRDARGPPCLALAEFARGADLVVASRGRPGLGHGASLVEGLVTVAGVPVLMAPPGVSGVAGHTVLVAWNGSREATRAVHDALPFLQHATRPVVLCAIGERAAAGLDPAIAMLERHQVRVHAERLEGAEAHAGEILLAQAAAHGADLLVMGAYGHARLRELVFGGATRHVLHHATLPVLFSG